MKYRTLAEVTTPPFKPVTIAITMETKDELDAMTSIFAIGRIGTFLRDKANDSDLYLYNAFNAVGGRDRFVDEIKEKLKT